MHPLTPWPMVLGGVLALAACAAEPSMQAAPGGTWIVTDAFPAGPVTDPGSAPRGQMVRLDAAMAGDAAGRACPWPRYGGATLPLGTVLGAAGTTDRLAAPVSVLEVECAGQPFSSYAAMADGSLLTRHGPWLLRLEPGRILAANPAPMVPDAPPIMLVPPPAAPMPAAAAPSPSGTEPTPPPAVLVYLASYRTEAWARKGWDILAARSAGLKAVEPVTRSVEVKGKGRFIRLFAPAKDAADGKRICAELGQAIAECGAAGREN